MREVMKPFPRMLSQISGAFIIAAILAGCATLPENKAHTSGISSDLMKEVMGRKDKIVHLSSGANSQKPVLLLLHGATDEPSEMLDIASRVKNA